MKCDFFHDEVGGILMLKIQNTIIYSKFLRITNCIDNKEMFSILKFKYFVKNYFLPADRPARKPVENAIFKL